MHIFIDESGNLGKDGKYFVLAFVYTSNSKRIKNIFKKACKKYCTISDIPLDEIKTSALTLPQKQEMLNKIAKIKDFHCGYIVAQKNEIMPHILSDKNLCYNYLCKLLLKTLFKENIPNNQDVTIVLDNRTQKVASRNTLPDYIKIEAFDWNHSGKIEINYQESHMVYGLQCADFVSNIVYGKYTYDKRNGLYANLKPLVIVRERFPRDKFLL